MLSLSLFLLRPNYFFFSPWASPPIMLFNAKLLRDGAIRPSQWYALPLIELASTRRISAVMIIDSGVGVVTYISVVCSWSCPWFPSWQRLGSARSETELNQRARGGLLLQLTDQKPRWICFRGCVCLGWCE